MNLIKRIIPSFTRSKERINLSRLERVLFIKLFAIGDCLNSTPALRALRKAAPSAQIDVLVGRWSSPVFRGNPHLNRLIIAEDEWFRRPNPLSLLKLVRRFRSTKYDAVLLFHRAPSLGAFITACRIPIRIGIDLENDGYWLTHPVKEAGISHETVVYGSLLEPLGLELDDHRMEIFTSVHEKERAGLLWEAGFGNESGVVIGIIPGGAVNPGQSMPQKIWSYYPALTELLLKRGYRIAYFGGEGDRLKLAELPSGNEAVSFIGSGSLGLSAELMKRCDLIITHDSGPMHLAAATGAKVLSIFAPTDPLRYAPLGKDHHYLKSDVDCAPCYHRGRWQKGCDRDCISGIKVDQVLTEVDSMLSK